MRKVNENLSNRKSIFDTLRGDDGSMSSHAIVGIGSAALAATLTLLAVSYFGEKTEITITAQAVADEISLPASLNVASVFGGSSSETDIDIKQTTLWQDYSIGHIIFPTSVIGEDSIELHTLKDEKNNSKKPEASNTDKNVRVYAEETDGQTHLIIEVDPSALSASTKNMKSGPGSLETTGLISTFRSLPLDLAEQITTGSAEWNVENYRISCAKMMTKQEIVKAGIAKSVVTQIQIATPLIVGEFVKLYPDYKDHPEILEQVMKHLATLQDPANIEVRFVKDPNNPSASHDLVSEDSASYNQAADMTADNMISNIGAKKEAIGVTKLNSTSSSCELSASAKADLGKIISVWHARTPYDDTKIGKLNADASK
jgi:hypothetical protein